MVTLAPKLKCFCFKRLFLSVNSWNYPQAGEAKLYNMSSGLNFLNIVLLIIQQALNGQHLLTSQFTRTRARTHARARNFQPLRSLHFYTTVFFFLKWSPTKANATWGFVITKQWLILSCFFLSYGQTFLQGLIYFTSNSTEEEVQSTYIIY